MFDNIVPLSALPNPIPQPLSEVSTTLAPLRKRGAAGEWHALEVGFGRTDYATDRLNEHRRRAIETLYAEGTLGYEFAINTINGSPTLIGRFNPDI